MKQLLIKPNFTLIQNDNYRNYWSVKRKKTFYYANDYQRNRAEIIVKRLECNKSLLDLGSGDGCCLSYISKKIQLNALAVDFSDAPLAHLRKLGYRTKRLDLRNLGDLRKLGKYDYILLLEVIEHFSNSEELLLTALSLCNSKLFFSIPNTGYISYRLRLLFGSFPIQWKVQPGEHLRFWTFTDLLIWLNSLKLKNQATIFPYMGFPLLNKILPNLFAAGILVEIQVGHE